MVVSNVGALPEMVPDGKAGYVVEPEPEAIAEAIRKYFDEKKEQEFTENVKIEKEKVQLGYFPAGHRRSRRKNNIGHEARYTEAKHH